jgi:hypothetical protein
MLWEQAPEMRRVERNVNASRGADLFNAVRRKAARQQIARVRDDPRVLPVEDDAEPLSARMLGNATVAEVHRE